MPVNLQGFVRMTIRLKCVCGNEWDAEGPGACPICKAADTERVPALEQPATVALTPPPDGMALTVELRPGQAGAPGGRGLRAPVLVGYEMQGELGRGGLGGVYRPRQSTLNRVVARQMIPAGRPAP